MKIKKVIVIGLGYVGLSNLCILSKNYKVHGFDLDKEKIKLLENCISPLQEDGMHELIKKYKSNTSFSSTLSSKDMDADVALLALPTDYSIEANKFDTSILNSTIGYLDKQSFNGIVVIRSTIPFGYSEEIVKKHPKLRIVFVPEFLREGKAISDQLTPSRMVFSGNINDCHALSSFFNSCTLQKFTEIYCSYAEAEAIKLFSNTFLAARIGLFNEIDNFCIDNNICAKNVIEGMSADTRIGDYYNNPSFGYGGYCLPKDTIQTENMVSKSYSPIITSISSSNALRKEKIASMILEKKPNTVGIYKLAMKSGSDNLREAAVLDIAEQLKIAGCKIYLYEPSIHFKNSIFDKSYSSFDLFLKDSDIVLANRLDKDLEKYSNKIFTRDIFGDG